MRPSFVTSLWGVRDDYGYFELINSSRDASSATLFSYYRALALRRRRSNLKLRKEKEEEVGFLLRVRLDHGIRRFGLEERESVLG